MEQSLVTSNSQRTLSVGKGGTYAVGQLERKDLEMIQELNVYLTSLFQAG